MRFRILHETVYRYGSPASESVGEIRLFPQDTAHQRIHGRQLLLDPEAVITAFVDFFGNTVECFSIPHRHQRLRVRLSAEVETQSAADPGLAAEIPVGEARRPGLKRKVDLYHYRLPTRLVPLGLVPPAEYGSCLRDQVSLREAVLGLSRWIHLSFRYQPGVTEVGTPIRQVLTQRSGVCQDFAHLMLSILRTHGLASRYVSGYIEPRDPGDHTGSELAGAAASHAWVEVALPDGTWWGVDPTNDQCAGERHVVVAVGRDYHDVAPLRGTYKGASSQKLKVIVSMRRRRRGGSA